MADLFVRLAAAAALAFAGPAAAQVQTVDLDQSANSWEIPAETSNPYGGENYTPETQTWPEPPAQGQSEWVPVAPGDTVYPEGPAARNQVSPPSTPSSDTIPREDVFTAAEDLFGKGAEGLAGILENILRDQGEPTAYIAGQEAGGAFVFGVRYGSGTMRHQIEGDRAVYWTGPSLGFDVGANASKVFVLVYNLHDSQDLFHRFPGAAGNAYFVGGFSAQYLRRGDVVLIPIRLGVGLRLGVNAGYMRFSQRNRWVPF